MRLGGLRRLLPVLAALCVGVLIGFQLPRGEPVPRRAQGERRSAAGTTLASQGHEVGPFGMAPATGDEPSAVDSAAGEPPQSEVGGSLRVLGERGHRANWRVEDPRVNGLREGIYRVWYPDSEQLSTEVHYHKGRLHGSFRRWSVNGTLIVEGNYVDGRRDGILRTFDRASGRPVSEARFADDQLQGTRRRWNESGTLVEEVSYVNGVMHGARRWWYANGQLVRELRYEFERIVDGSYEEFYESGELRGRETYADDLLDGIWVRYYRDGAVAEKGEYRAGRKAGTWRTWDEHGTLVEQTTEGDDRAEPGD